MCVWLSEGGEREEREGGGGGGGGMRYNIKLYKKVKGIITGSGTRRRQGESE